MYIKTILTGTLCLLLTACASTKNHFASKTELDADINAAVEELYQHSSSARTLARKASGMLVFPSVVKGGIGVGGEYGEGALLINNRTENYYNIVSGSIGFQLGLQVKKQVILFMNDESLNRFRSSSGWEAGVDGSVAIATLGAGGEISTETAQRPIIGFIFSNKGLMYNLTFEGSKITRVEM